MRLFLCLLLLPGGLFAAPEIRVPERVRGEAGAFLRVAATTEGKQVRWVALTPGLSVFPADLLRDSRTTVVVALRPGSYRLLAITAVADELSEPAVCVVEVGSEPAPPGPEPVPPDDALARELARLYAADPGADRAAHVRALAAFYRQAARTVATAELRTAGDLYTVLRQAATAVLPDDALVGVRRRIATELKGVLPTRPDAPLSETHRTAACALFGRLASLLEALP